ncbi:hypothetical protein SBA7_320054 [Candidatus Sulfotelmatobacter sp. SbA7]|nr:hypothetical protein SBA7_320054 [Candidatus Sulfotelmatobacter sp. SbA7]
MRSRRLRRSGSRMSGLLILEGFCHWVFEVDSANQLSGDKLIVTQVYFLSLPSWQNVRQEARQ